MFDVSAAPAKLRRGNDAIIRDAAAATSSGSESRARALRMMVVVVGIVTVVVSVVWSLGRCQFVVRDM